MTRWGFAVVVLAVVVAGVWLAQDGSDHEGVETLMPRAAPDVPAAPLVDADEEPAVLDTPTPADERERALAARLPPGYYPTRARPLEVFDTDTGRRIVAGTILAHPGDQQDEYQLVSGRGAPLSRAAFTTTLVDGTLPDTLEIPFDDILLWFGAEGYAWRWVLARGDPGAPLRVGLSAGTHVLVELDDTLESARYGTTLVVRPAADLGRPWIVRPEWPTTDLGTLGPGGYDLELRTAAEFEAGRVHADALFELYGEPERVVRLSAAERPPGATLVIEYLTDAPRDGRDSIRLERYDAAGGIVRAAGENRGHAWPLQGGASNVTYDDLEPGRYRVTVGWLGRARDVELRSGETTRVEVVHRASAEVAVVGSPNARVQWSYVDDATAGSWRRLDETGRATLRFLPDLPIELQAHCGSTSSPPVTVTPRAGETLEVSLACVPERPSTIELLLTMHDMGSMMTTPFDHLAERIDVRPIAHDGQLVDLRSHLARQDGARLTLVVSEPGPYEVTISPPHDVAQTFTRSPGGGLDDAIEVVWSP